MAPNSALSLLAAEVPEFSVRHGLAGPEVGDLDEHPLQAPGPHDPVVSARAPAPAAIPGSTPQSSSSPPALVHPGMDATLEHVFEQLSLPERLRGPLLALVGAEPTDDAETFSAITWEMYQADVVAQFEFEDGSRPTIFEKPACCASTRIWSKCSQMRHSGPPPLQLLPLPCRSSRTSR